MITRAPSLATGALDCIRRARNGGLRLTGGRWAEVPDADDRQPFLLCSFHVPWVTLNLVSFRALARSDFPLLQRWLSEPHIDAWWQGPLDLPGLEQKYGPRVDHIEPCHVLGDASLLGMGIGSAAIRKFILDVVSAEPLITAVVTDPEERNDRSCRAFEKAGFVRGKTVKLEGESVWRQIMRLWLTTS
jgi:aminoglycoside 6'-N-acetyltransferase